jgi:hypothetical protein
MRINVSTAPAPKLQAPLDAVNGRATSHTITRPEEVRSIAKEAETALDKLGLPQAHRRGARAEHVSGKGLPNAYRHTGIATRLLFERGSKAWFLVDVQRARAYPGDTGRGTRVSISADQERQAGEALRRTLGITILSAPA